MGSVSSCQINGDCVRPLPSVRKHASEKILTTHQETTKKPRKSATEKRKAHQEKSAHCLLSANTPERENTKQETTHQENQREKKY